MSVVDMVVVVNRDLRSKHVSRITAVHGLGTLLLLTTPIFDKGLTSAHVELGFRKG